MYKNRQIWLLVSIVIIAMGFAQPILDKEVKNDNATICKKLFRYSDLNRKLHNQEIYRNKQERQRIEALLHKFKVPFHWSEDNQNSVFEGLDIDGDGKNDEIVRSCGAGAGMLCSLFITFSSGGYNNDFESVFFWLGKIGKDVYLVEEVDGTSFPYSNKDITRVYRVTKDSTIGICSK